MTSLVELDRAEALQPLSVEERVLKKEERFEKRRRSRQETEEKDEKSPRRSRKRDKSSRSRTPKKKSFRCRSESDTPTKVTTVAWVLQKAAND